MDEDEYYEGDHYTKVWLNHEMASVLAVGDELWSLFHSGILLSDKDKRSQERAWRAVHEPPK